MSDNEVRVRIYITEPSGREVEVEQYLPEPRTTDHRQVLAVLDSTVQLARSRYAPRQPHVFGHSTGGNPDVLLCNDDTDAHAWSYGTRDSYRVCTRCHKTEDVPS